MKFTVHGIPQTAGSKRAFPFKKRNGKLGVAVSDDNPRTKSSQAAVAEAAAEAMGGEPLLTGPLLLTCSFVFPRPKSHYGTGRNSETVKDSAPNMHAVRPDVLKLARAIEDAMTSIVWRDDSQIVAEVLVKSYGEPARVDIEVREVTGNVLMAELGVGVAGRDAD